jgi:hypothetical protein
VLGRCFIVLHGVMREQAPLDGGAIGRAAREQDRHSEEQGLPA